MESVMLNECGTRSPKKVKVINFKREPFHSNTFYRGDETTIHTENIICRVEETSYSKDQSGLTIEEEAYYSLLAHILEHTDQRSKDELQEEEEERDTQWMIRRSFRKRKRVYQDFLYDDEGSE